MSPSARVLIVEDEPSIRNAFAFALEDERWVVETAADGIDATGKVGEKRYGLLLADLRMPGLDGIGLIRRMRANQDYTSAMLCTADLKPLDLLNAVRLGVVTFLLKPISLTMLRSVVESVLCRRNHDPMEMAFREAEKLHFRRAGEKLRLLTTPANRQELNRWANLFTGLDDGAAEDSLLHAAGLVLDDVKTSRVIRPIYGASLPDGPM